MIGEVFTNIVKEVKTSMKQNNHQNPVDLEISFESLEIDKRGGLFVPKKSQKRELSIRLATRIGAEE